MSEAGGPGHARTHAGQAKPARPVSLSRARFVVLAVHPSGHGETLGMLRLAHPC
jgi:hypothetical protein